MQKTATVEPVVDAFVQTANPTPDVDFGWDAFVQTANPTPDVDFGWKG